MPETAPYVDVQLLDHPVEQTPLSPFPDDCGAECVFIGRTRVDHHEVHGRLVRLRYHAYRPLATSELRTLALHAAERFGCSCVRIHHALGEVLPGGASVLVQVATGHRGAAFEAGRFVMEELKRKAPIWKQEFWADGTTWSEGATVAEGMP